MSNSCNSLVFSGCLFRFYEVKWSGGLLCVDDFFDSRADGVCPDVVAFGGEVEEVVHVVGADGAVGLEVFLVDVDVFDGLAGEFGDELVDGGSFLAAGVGFFADGEEADEEDFCLGLFGLDEVDDGFDACGGVFGVGVVLPEVVGADHDDEEFGLVAFEVAVGESPECVLGLVAADSHVE